MDEKCPRRILSTKRFPKRERAMLLGAGGGWYVFWRDVVRKTFVVCGRTAGRRRVFMLGRRSILRLFNIHPGEKLHHLHHLPMVHAGTSPRRHPVRLMLSAAPTPTPTPLLSPIPIGKVYYTILVLAHTNVAHPPAHRVIVIKNIY